MSAPTHRAIDLMSLAIDLLRRLIQLHPNLRPSDVVKKSSEDFKIGIVPALKLQRR